MFNLSQKTGLRLALIALLLVCAAFAPSKSRTANASAKENITVGALLSLSGSAASQGQAAKAVLDAAVQDFNDGFNQNPDRTPYAVQAIVFDTESNPDVAIQRLQFLASVGVKVVLGPLTSSEIDTVRAFADENDILLISTTSTAPSLAVEGDNVFRLVPDDDRQGLAAATLMKRKGTESAAFLYLDDLYGQELSDSVVAHWIEAGGDAIGVQSFPMGTTDFSSILQKLNEDIERKAAESEYETIGVYLASYDEAVQIFKQARQFPALSKVKWYGCDGVALSTALTADAEAAEFARSVCFTNPVFGGNMTASPKYQRVLNIVKERTGITPNAQVMAVYDALNLVTAAYRQANMATTFESLKQELIRAADSYSGITGSAVLNEAGDRVIGDYDFWNVARDGDAYTWVRTGIFLDTWGDMPDFLYFSGCPQNAQSEIPAALLHE